MSSIFLWILSVHAFDHLAVLDKAFPPVFSQQEPSLAKDAAAISEVSLMMVGLLAPVIYHKNPAPRLDEIILDNSVSATRSQFGVDVESGHYHPLSDEDLPALRAEGRAYQKNRNRMVELKAYLDGGSVDKNFVPHGIYSPEEELEMVSRDHRLQMINPDERRPYLFEELDSNNALKRGKFELGKEFRADRIKRNLFVGLGILGAFSGVIRKAALENSREPGVFPLYSLAEAFAKEASADAELFLEANPTFDEAD